MRPPAKFSRGRVRRKLLLFCRDVKCGKYPSIEVPTIRIKERCVQKNGAGERKWRMPSVFLSGATATEDRNLYWKA